MLVPQYTPIRVKTGGGPWTWKSNMKSVLSKSQWRALKVSIGIRCTGDASEYRWSCPLNPLSNITTPWASYQIRKIAGCACAGNAGNVFPRRRFQRKPLVSDPGMHHGTCVTHVPWCMSGSLTCGDGENVPGNPGACAPANLRIWQEAHGLSG